jgi:hypothetical protein
LAHDFSDEPQSVLPDPALSDSIDWRKIQR